MQKSIEILESTSSGKGKKTEQNEFVFRIIFLIADKEKPSRPLKNPYVKIRNLKHTNRFSESQRITARVTIKNVINKITLTEW